MLFILSPLFLIGSPKYIYTTASANQWNVFSPTAITSPNLVINSGFEEGLSESADTWGAYELGYTIDTIGGRNQSRALKLTTLRITNRAPFRS